MVSLPLDTPVSPFRFNGARSFAATCFGETFFVDECEFGLGVFTKRDIASGEVILEFDGPVIDFAETKRRGPRECMAIQIGPDRYLDTRPPGVLVNHSCNPNSGIRGDKYLVALKPLRAGLEIRYDYSTTMEEQSFTMACQCGEPGCRRVIGDFSELPWRTRARYISKGIVMSFILQRLGLYVPATRGVDPGNARP
jgi:hypothetical protein